MEETPKKIAERAAVCGEERCVTTLKTAAKETSFAFIDHATKFFGPRSVLQAILSNKINKINFCLLIVPFMGPGTHRK